MCAGSIAAFERLERAISTIIDEDYEGDVPDIFASLLVEANANAGAPVAPPAAPPPPSPLSLTRIAMMLEDEDASSIPSTETQKGVTHATLLNSCAPAPPPP